MKETRAELFVAVNLNCPHCGADIDLLNDSDTFGVDHNKGAAITSQLQKEDDDFSVESVRCTECSRMFNVRGINL